MIGREFWWKQKRIAGAALALFGLGAILWATLTPFTVYWRKLSLSEYFRSFEHTPSAMLDFPENIVLFMPLGLGLALAMGEGFGSVRRRLGLIAVIGFLLSLSVESLQIFIPKRIPNVSDIVSNSLGALAGAGLLQLWHRRNEVPSAIRARIIRWDVRIAFGCYLSVLLCATWLLMNGLRPAFWDAGYRLAIGNETTQNWGWNGTMRDLVLLPEGVTGSEATNRLTHSVPEQLEGKLSAYYPLSSPEGLKERGNRLPEFVQQGRPAEFSTNGVVLKPDSWLRTRRSLADFAAAVNRTRKYTIAATISTPKPRQWEGPRIVSLSARDEETDVMISHYRDEIEFRWRAPLTGEGTNPQLYFPGTFRSSEPFRFVVTQRKNTIGFYTSEGVALEVFLGPEVGLAALLTEDSQWLVQVTPRAFWPAAAFFALLFYAPAGAYLGLWLKFARPAGVARFPAVPALCWFVLLPVSVEIVVAVYGERSFRIGFVVVGVLCAALGFVAARGGTRFFRLAWLSGRKHKAA